MPLEYSINFLGFEQENVESGDVLTRDGEHLGKWVYGEQYGMEWYYFIPNGMERPTLSDHHLSFLLALITEWHKSRNRVTNKRLATTTST
ncbi:hypothetical protein AB3Y40_19830 [Yoonia sp. R2331]|uniref:hypothetical protein n=1 Tax=Yoonia sp. R2331 TaxID=3237238 RepID=UPI0034E53D5E